MKTCAYCGRANEDTATTCLECGTDQFKPASAPAEGAPRASAEPPPLPVRDLSTNHEQLFRALVVVSQGAYFISLLAPYVEAGFRSGQTLALLDMNGYGALVVLPRSIIWLTAGVYLAIAVGLWRFSAAARMAYTILTVGYAMLTLAFGVAVFSPPVSFLGWITTAADGAIFALAYATPLKDRFK